MTHQEQMLTIVVANDDTSLKSIVVFDSEEPDRIILKPGQRCRFKVPADGLTIQSASNVEA